MGVKEPIRVFTDGGYYDEVAPICVSVSHAVIDGKEVPISKTITSGIKGSMYAEMIAINTSLFTIRKMIDCNDIKGKRLCVELITDNYGCVESIRSVLAGTYPKKLRCSRDRYLQSLIDDSARQIKVIRAHVTLIHIKSHIKPYQMVHAYKKFMSVNKMDISYSEFVQLWKQNEKCDCNVRRAYSDYISLQ